MASLSAPVSASLPSNQAAEVPSLDIEVEVVPFISAVINTLKPTDGFFLNPARFSIRPNATGADLKALFLAKFPKVKSQVQFIFLGNLIQDRTILRNQEFFKPEPIIKEEKRSSLPTPVKITNGATINVVLRPNEENK